MDATDHSARLRITRTPHAPRPSLAQAATFLLASLTAVILLALALTLNSPSLPRTTPLTTAQTALVQRFYAAVNRLLAGGDSVTLASLLAPNVVAHLPDRQITGRFALVAYVTATRQAAPGLRLAPTTLLVDGDQVATEVELSSLASPAPNRILTDPALAQTEPERFRLTQGRITEYWSALDASALPHALPPLTLALASGPRQVDLARLTFPPGATLADLVAPAPHLLLPETGAVTVTFADRAAHAQALRGDAVAAGWQPAGPEPVVLRPGDALLIPSGTPHAIRNATPAAVSLLGVFLAGADDLTDLQRQQSPNHADPPKLVSIYAMSPLRAAVHWNGGATIDLLARGTDDDAAAQNTLTISWLVLAPGQTIASHPIAGAELLALESGAALSGDARRSGPAAADAVAPGVGTASAGSPSARVLVAGDGIAATSGRSKPVANTGRVPTQLVLVQIAPAPSTAPRRVAAAR